MAAEGVPGAPSPIASPSLGTHPVGIQPYPNGCPTAEPQAPASATTIPSGARQAGCALPALLLGAPSVPRPRPAAVGAPPAPRPNLRKGQPHSPAHSPITQEPGQPHSSSPQPVKGLPHAPNPCQPHTRGSTSSSRKEQIPAWGHTAGPTSLPRTQPHGPASTADPRSSPTSRGTVWGRAPQRGGTPPTAPHPGARPARSTGAPDLSPIAIPIPLPIAVPIATPVPARPVSPPRIAGVPGGREEPRPDGAGYLVLGAARGATPGGRTAGPGERRARRPPAGAGEEGG